MTEKDREFFDIIDEECQKQRGKSIPMFLLLSIPGAIFAALLMWWCINFAIPNHQAYALLLIPILFGFLGYLFLVLRVSLDRTIKNWDNTEMDKKVDKWMKKWNIPQETDDTI